MTPSATAQSAPLLELDGVGERYGNEAALSDIDIAVHAGEVHCLLGDNGAGKSTLMKIMSGVVAPSAGTVRYEGRPVAPASPRDALALGIATVHQDVGSVLLMSVTRNFFLGREPTRGRGPFRRIDFDLANRVAIERIQRMGIRRITDPGQLVGTMSGGERQALAIARALHFGAKVLILNEPTAALGVRESAVVIDLIRAARAEGVALVFITHNAAHAFGRQPLHGALAGPRRRQVPPRRARAGRPRDPDGRRPEDSEGRLNELTKPICRRR